MLTNTGESVKIEQVDYLLAADDLPLFSIILKGGSTIDGVSQVTFSDVTSVICRENKCEACDKTDCLYRKEANQ